MGFLGVSVRMGYFAKSVTQQWKGFTIPISIREFNVIKQGVIIILFAPFITSNLKNSRLAQKLKTLGRRPRQADRN